MILPGQNKEIGFHPTCKREMLDINDLNREPEVQIYEFKPDLDVSICVYVSMHVNGKKNL